jgi:hypothetical protein
MESRKMQFEGAVVREQGITFAVVVVKKQVIDYASRAAEAVRGFARMFPGMPVVLMAQDGHGVPTYYGRRDIVNFLSGISPSRIPWRRYSYS